MVEVRMECKHVKAGAQEFEDGDGEERDIR